MPSTNQVLVDAIHVREFIGRLIVTLNTGRLATGIFLRFFVGYIFRSIAVFIIAPPCAIPVSPGPRRRELPRQSPPAKAVHAGRHGC